LNKKFNIQTVLVAPLDWGLGHATRCIPIISALLKNNYTVILAASGKQKILLQQEFPEIKIIDLKGYNIQYSKTSFGLPFKIFLQIPKIVWAIYYEHKWLKKIVNKHAIDCVISDNRYGLFSKKIPTVFITHQLTIKMPFLWLQSFVQKINYKFINQFTACWIPDVEGKDKMAGILSHPTKYPSMPIHYLGNLSRFEWQNTVETYTYKYCILLSGPEPQRSILEKIIIKDLPNITQQVLLIRGLPNGSTILPTNNNVIVKNHLPGVEICKALQQSEWIICRSGYTTIMEILSLRKKAVLIPTPAQTEQEYLANFLMQKQWCYSVAQNKFVLSKERNNIENFSFHVPVIGANNLQQTIPVLLNNLIIYSTNTTQYEVE